MAELSITGQMKVETLQKNFFEEFGLNLRVYDGRSFAESDQTIAQVRKTKGTGKNLSVAKNMKIGNLETKLEDEYGLKVQVAGSRNDYLCDNNLTLAGALQKDQEKISRKRNALSSSSAARSQDDLPNQGNWQGDEYFINYDKARDACSIIWMSEDYEIAELEPYISSIQCDDGEDFYELINAEWPDAQGQDDFRTIEVSNFAALEGDGEKEYLLCFTAVVSINLNVHPAFREALEKADHLIVARIDFKRNGKPILDDNGDREYLFEMDNDQFVELEPKV